MKKYTKKPIAVKTVTVKAHTRKIKTTREVAVAKPMVKPITAKVAPKKLSVIRRNPLAVNSQFLLITGTSSMQVALAVSSIPVVVTHETDKAWQVTAITDSGECGFPCWLPKSAIEPQLAANCYSLADWFLISANSYVKRWISYNARHAIVAA